MLLETTSFQSNSDVASFVPLQSDDFTCRPPAALGRACPRATFGPADLSLLESLTHCKPAFRAGLGE
jgi:hypothetical protein